MFNRKPQTELAQLSISKEYNMDYKLNKMITIIFTQFQHIHGLIY